MHDLLAPACRPYASWPGSSRHLTLFMPTARTVLFFVILLQGMVLCEQLPYAVNVSLSCTAVQDLPNISFSMGGSMFSVSPAAYAYRVRLSPDLTPAQHASTTCCSLRLHHGAFHGHFCGRARAPYPVPGVAQLPCMYVLAPLSLLTLLSCGCCCRAPGTCCAILD